VRLPQLTSDLNLHRHPGEGRDPVGKVEVTTRNANQTLFPNWAPAFAGVVTAIVARVRG